MGHPAGSETLFSKTIEVVRVAHRAGTRTLFSKNVEVLRVVHPAGSETLFSKNVEVMKAAHHWNAGTSSLVAQVFLTVVTISIWNDADITPTLIGLRILFYFTCCIYL